MNNYNQINKQIEELTDQVNQSGEKVLKLSLKTQLLMRHRQLINQALASLKAGDNPKTVLQKLKTGTDQITKWAKDQNVKAQESLDQELTRLSIDQHYT